MFHFSSNLKPIPPLLCPMNCALPQESPSFDISALLNAEARRYYIKDVMNVTMAKLVLGDPLTMPIIDGRHVRRCFDGASLLSHHCCCTGGRARPCLTVLGPR